MNVHNIGAERSQNAAEILDRLPRIDAAGECTQSAPKPWWQLLAVALEHSRVEAALPAQFDDSRTGVIRAPEPPVPIVDMQDAHPSLTPAPTQGLERHESIAFVRDELVGIAYVRAQDRQHDEGDPSEHVSDGQDQIVAPRPEATMPH